MNAALLREQFQAARRSGQRAQDAARAIGVSEGEAVAAHAGQHGLALRAVPLRGPWIELLQALEPCGPLLALTRNASAVHEKTGVYRQLSANGHVGLALGEEIDLRLFFNQWHAGFAVTEEAAQPGNPPSLSLQFFDPHGVAVHKIHAREGSDRDALQAVIARHAEPALGYVFRQPAAPAPQPPDAHFDAAAFTEAWSAMQDTHEFFPLLRQFGVERQQGLRLARGRYTAQAPASAVRDLLQEAAFDGLPIMVFVGSPGCIQIHTGPVSRVQRMGPWLNVMDPGFNLHLREDRIADVWLVTKPTSDGPVTSIEAFAEDGELIAMFFGERKPGKPELPAWRDLAHGLPRQKAEQVAA